MRHFLDLEDVPPLELRSILYEAHGRKKARAGFAKGAPDADRPLADHVLATIFEKNSTRTRVSFDIAMRQLGGGALYMDSTSSQLGRGETVADTARVLSRMVDGMMLRANSHASLLELAAHSSVPVINGLTDHSHPCQILADLMTLEEAGMTLKGARLAWVGDGNNVLTSLMQAAPAFGYSIAIATPRTYAPKQAEVDKAISRGARIQLGDDAAEAVAGADSVITDTWVSMGDTDVSTRMQAFGPFEVNDALMAKANKGAVFLHCLPAHRGEEVSDSVIDGPQSRVFDEAENRIHAQKAVLTWCFRD